LSGSTKDSELESFVSKHGEIEHCEIIKDRRTNQSKRFAFIRMKSVEDAKKAKEGLAGQSLDGKSIRIDFSRTDKAHSPTPGRYMGKITRPRYSGRRYGSSYGSYYKRSSSRDRSRDRDYRYSDYRRRSYDRYSNERYDDYDRYRRR